MPKQFYSASEAAKMLGISLDTLRRWDRAGRIETVRDMGNRRIVASTEIQRLRGDGDAGHLSARNRLRGTVSDVKVDGLPVVVATHSTTVPLRAVLRQAIDDAAE